MDGQGENSPRQVIGHRHIRRLAPEDGLSMRRGEVHAGFDPLLRQVVDHGIPPGRVGASQCHRVEHVHVVPVASHHRRLHAGHRIEAPIEVGRQRALAGEDGVELGRLGPAHGRLHLGQSPVTAQDRVLVGRHLAVVAQQAQLAGQVAVAGQDHPTLAGRDVLRGGEAEHARHAPRPHVAAPVAGAVGLRCVLQEHHAGIGGEGRELGQVGGLAPVVNGQDALDPRTHPAGHVGRVQVERVRVDIGEDRCGAGVDDGRGRRHEGQRRHDDLVTRSDAEGGEERHQGDGPVGEGDPVLRW